MKTKISIIEPVGGHGGMDFYDYGLAEGLAANDVEITLYTCNSTKTQEIEGVRTVKCFGDIWQQPKAKRLFTFIRGYYRAFRDSKKNKVTCVHLHFFLIRKINVLALLLARPFSFKKVLTIHDVDPLVNSAPKILHKWTYKLVDDIVVHNTFSKSELRNKQVTKKTIHVIPHGNYLSSITPVEPKKFDGTLRILFFGQIKEEKGLSILLKAVKLLADQKAKIHLTIAGRPWRMSTEEYDQFIQKNQLEAYISSRFEYIPNEEVIDYFSQADLVVLPYKRIYQSGVLLMTMSYGVPVMVSDLEPMKEIIKNEINGFTFKSENHQDLANQLTNLCANPDKLIDVAQKASSDISEKYDWKVIGSQLKKVYLS